MLFSIQIFEDRFVFWESLALGGIVTCHLAESLKMPLKIATIIMITTN